MEKQFDIRKLQRFEKLIDRLSPNLDKNSIKLLNWVLEELSLRQKKTVTEYGKSGYCICPNCYGTIDPDYISYCKVCGQKLDHSLAWRKMKLVSYEEIKEREIAQILNKSAPKPVEAFAVPTINSNHEKTVITNKTVDRLNAEDIDVFITANKALIINTIYEMLVKNIKSDNEVNQVLLDYSPISVSLPQEMPLSYLTPLRLSVKFS